MARVVSSYSAYSWPWCYTAGMQLEMANVPQQRPWVCLSGLLVVMKEAAWCQEKGSTQVVRYLCCSAVEAKWGAGRQGLAGAENRAAWHWLQRKTVQEHRGLCGAGEGAEQGGNRKGVMCGMRAGRRRMAGLR